MPSFSDTLSAIIFSTPFIIAILHNKITEALGNGFIILITCMYIQSLIERQREEVTPPLVRANGLNLSKCDICLRKDKKVVLVAVKQNGLALKFASKELRADKEVVVAALAQNGLARRFASNNLAGDKELWIDILRYNARDENSNKLNEIISSTRTDKLILGKMADNFFNIVTEQSIKLSQALLRESILAKIFFKQHGLYLPIRVFLRFARKITDAKCITDVLIFLLPPDLPQIITSASYSSTDSKVFGTPTKEKAAPFTKANSTAEEYNPDSSKHPVASAAAK